MNLSEGDSVKVFVKRLAEVESVKDSHACPTKFCFSYSLDSISETLLISKYTHLKFKAKGILNVFSFPNYLTEWARGIRGQRERKVKWRDQKKLKGNKTCSQILEL